MFFISKQKKVETQIAAYGEQVALCLERTFHTFEAYFSTGDHAALGKLVEEVHRAESRADDIRREVEVMMYSKTIFPESRGDILGLLESLDRVPNQAETCPRKLYIEHIVVPDTLKPAVMKLLDIGRTGTQALLEAVHQLFNNFSRAGEAVARVDQCESQADRLENQLIEQVFASDMDGVQKILLRDLIARISGICDRAQATADRIRIMVAKRRI